MRTRVRSALVLVCFSVFFFASISQHLFHDLFSIDGFRPSPSHLSTSKPLNPNLAILDSSSSSSSSLPLSSSSPPLSSPPPPPQIRQQQREEEDDGGTHLHVSLPKAPPDSILFPDWEVVLLLPISQLSLSDPSRRDYSCLFPNGATSPAKPSGVLPWGGRATFKCTMPFSVRRRLPFPSPFLTDSPEAFKKKVNKPLTAPDIFRWNFLSYESLSTADDVIVFAKGINSRQGVNLLPASIRCVFAGGATTPVTSSFQEVFRCPHPDPPAPTATKVSLELADTRGVKRILPSVAAYEQPARRTLAQLPQKKLLCACTVVFNVAKFLKEWVLYYSRIGVEKFVLYDNSSDDNLSEVVAHLLESGHDVMALLWPWSKTQEAAFSHCAATMNNTCTWMMYVDVDEFLFAPSWANESQPSKRMLLSLLIRHSATSSQPTGQVSIKCLEFGPSNRSSHPKEGVTQGYTCRARIEQRHKSIVRLDAVDPSLPNVVHHFEMRKGFGWRKVGPEEAVVNHYKYQAWTEFRHKFRRRVSAYVYDWKDGLNPHSKDRPPGLGNVAELAKEPEGWATRFCEVNDSRLRDVSRRWFGSRVAAVEPAAQETVRLEWEEE